MSAPVFYPGSIFEDAVVTVPGESDDFPAVHLSDRNIVNLWKDVATSGTRTITARKIGNALAPDTLILPAGHGFAGVALTVASSPDGGSYTSRKAVTPADAGAVRVALDSTALVDYWRLAWTTPAAPVYVGEVFLTKAVPLPHAPSLDSFEDGRDYGITRLETRAGYPHKTRRYGGLWRASYLQRDFTVAEWATLVAIFEEIAGSFAYFLDADGVLRFIEWQATSLVAKGVPVSRRDVTIALRELPTA